MLIFTLKIPQELIILLGFAMLVQFARKYNCLPSKVNGKYLFWLLISGAVGVLLPTSISSVLIVMYACLLIFWGVTYDVCPACFDRIGTIFKKKT